MGLPVAALDLAINSAIAFGDNGAPRTVAYRLHGGGAARGVAFLRFNEWLWTMLGQTGARLVAYEAPIIGGAPINANMALLLIGLAAQVEMVAASRDIPCISVAVQTVRKHSLGHGRPENPKRAVLQRCDQLGWDVGCDHNRADAAMLWMYVKSVHDKSFRVETGSPLFAAARAAGKVA